MAKDKLLSTIRGGLAQGDGTLIVGLSGIECAGKSTLAADLAQWLNAAGLRTYVLCIDRFLNPKPMRHQGETLAEAYYVSTFRFGDVFEQAIKPARRDGAICGELTVIDLDSESLKQETIHAPELDVLIIEGVFLFRAPLIEYFDLKVWVDIDFDRALERAVRRPQEVARYANQSAIAERFTSRYFPAQRRHIEEDRPMELADLVIKAEC